MKGHGSATRAVPGLAFAELRPGHLNLAFRYRTLPLPYPPDLAQVRE